MTAFDEQAPADVHALNEAAAWRERIQTHPSLELSDEFQGWIALLANRHAFNAIMQAENTLTTMHARPELLDLRSQALQRARNVHQKTNLTRRTLLRYCTSAAGLALVGMGGAWYYWISSTTYATPVDMRRKITLADGSRVALDSNTRIRVHYTKNARKIVLDHGQARFDVAHDKARPFSVTAGDETVVAVGTAFNVEKLDKKVLVTLIHGSIVVKNQNKRERENVKLSTISLSAGEELEAVADAKPVIKKANIEATNAWVSGQLIFHNTRLADAVERENRYTENPVIVTPQIADILINGVFHAGDIAAFVNAVTTLFPVQATTNAQDQIVLVAKN